VLKMDAAFFDASKGSRKTGLSEEEIMSQNSCPSVLTVNSGSSSLKFALYKMGEPEERVLGGEIERIGLRASAFHITDAHGETLLDRNIDLPDHDAAVNTLFGWLKNHTQDDRLGAVGHRVVHGGLRYSRPHLINPKLVDDLRALIPLAPEHLPHELKAIRAVSRSFIGLKQVACFDTAFHRHMPRLAQMYALPRSLWREGLTRFGFHGLSYEYILSDLKNEAGSEIAGGRVIIAHLGNGASLAAIHGGQCVDTTMGFTPTGGLMMGTRSGDLDPGVLIYLLQEKGWSPSVLGDMLNRRSGLLGVSGVSGDMKDLLQRRSEDPHAAEAVDLFCYQARKFLGSLVSVMGGMDTLVFTGGIGEKASFIRWRICGDLGFLGIDLDPVRNEAHAPVISRDESTTTVRVMETNEELMVARHTRDLLRRQHTRRDA
jgi:acetate kinase